MLIIKRAVKGTISHILFVVLRNTVLIALIFPNVSSIGYCIIDFEHFYVDEVMKPAMLMTS